jgi:hypothetical protein
MASLVQILAALLVLAGFVLVQARVLTPQARVYLVLNTVGAAVLALDAARHAQWGFLLLEGVWAAVSASALLRPSRRARPA